MFKLWGITTILIACPLLGALPLIAWITYALTNKRLANIGTGNISVSAAFYHGGKVAGILAVTSEAIKGIASVTIAHYFFPTEPVWEIIALICLVIGRYVATRGAGTTNVVWGFFAHDPMIAAWVTLLSAIGFIFLRSRQTIKFGVLVLFPLFVAVLHAQDLPRIIAAFSLAGLLGWIYTQIPDDMSLLTGSIEPPLKPNRNHNSSEKPIVTLDDELDIEIFGGKAATLSQIKRWGYSVPKGWVLSPIHDPTQLINFLQPSELSPLVVRSSAIGEDSEKASAAGLYKTVLNITNKQQLADAIAIVRESYNQPAAVHYRQNRGLQDEAMAVLIQPLVQSVFSGVAFSRDPLAQQGGSVVIEAVSGNPIQVVSGKITPEQYRVFVAGEENLSCIQFEGTGKIPQALIKQVAYLARRLERRYQGIPQDIEWIYDGQTLWVLQTRPITTLLPIWTRKIAAEVIPGVIHPLTWSINRPLTCGVWGEIFTLVLGDRAQGWDFNLTATLHYSRAYFNASFIGEILLNMGLPPESLDFLTRGVNISKPPLDSTWENLPGLTKLLQREMSLEQKFKQDYRQKFIPGLTQLANVNLEELSSPQLLNRLDLTLELLHQSTYYSILAPISAALRQSILGLKDEQIDHSITPEIASLRSLRLLANEARDILPAEIEPEKVFEQLAQTPEGTKILDEFAELLQDYAYLSEVGTDISVPTWREQPQLVKQMFIQLLQGTEPLNPRQTGGKERRQGGFVQRRIDLKGRVTEVYSRLLAELRWTILATEHIWLKIGLLQKTGDIFFLELDEIRRLVAGGDLALNQQLSELILNRRAKYEQDCQITQVPALVYGYNPPHPVAAPIDTSDHILLGIPASHGQVRGRVKILRTFSEINNNIDKQTILVVPYTDSGWAAILVQAGGIIAEAGGKLSHGAIVAREYGIPAVMDIRGATYLLQDGQQVKIDGTKGTVELLEF